VSEKIGKLWANAAVWLSTKPKPSRINQAILKLFV
jgi:hypothetical protein